MPSLHAVLLLSHAVFALTSLVFEPYVVLGAIDAKRQDGGCFAPETTSQGAAEPEGSVDTATMSSGWQAPVCGLWRWYALSFDPVFARGDDTPLFLRVMCLLDCILFGPLHVYMAWVLYRGRAHYSSSDGRRGRRAKVGHVERWSDASRAVGVPFAAALVYSTLVYFGWELWALWRGENDGASMVGVFIVNIPYTIVPLLEWRALSSARGAEALFAPKLHKGRQKRRDRQNQTEKSKQRGRRSSSRSSSRTPPGKRQLSSRGSTNTRSFVQRLALGAAIVFSSLLIFYGSHTPSVLFRRPSVRPLTRLIVAPNVELAARIQTSWAPIMDAKVAWLERGEIRVAVSADTTLETIAFDSSTVLEDVSFIFVVEADDWLLKRSFLRSELHGELAGAKGFQWMRVTVAVLDATCDFMKRAIQEAGYSCTDANERRELFERFSQHLVSRSETLRNVTWFDASEGHVPG